MNKCTIINGRMLDKLYDIMFHKFTSIGVILGIFFGFYGYGERMLTKRLPGDIAWFTNYLLELLVYIYSSNTTNDTEDYDILPKKLKFKTNLAFRFGDIFFHVLNMRNLVLVAFSSKVQTFYS